MECEQPNPDLRNFNGRLKVDLEKKRGCIFFLQVRHGDGSMIPGSLSLENVGLRGTQVINFCKIFLLKSSPQKPNFSSGTLIMCTGVQCIRVGIQKCPGYVRILVKIELTTCFQNSKQGKNKFSTVEVTMNRVLLVYMLILVLECTLCTILK